MVMSEGESRKASTEGDTRPRSREEGGRVNGVNEGWLGVGGRDGESGVSNEMDGLILCSSRLGFLALSSHHSPCLRPVLRLVTPFVPSFLGSSPPFRTSYPAPFVVSLARASLTPLPAERNPRNEGGGNRKVSETRETKGGAEGVRERSE